MQSPTPIDNGTTADGSYFQAIAKDVEAELLAVLTEAFEALAAVVINQENILVRLRRIAAPNNAVRPTRNDDSGHARHAYIQRLGGRKVSELGDSEAVETVLWRQIRTPS